MCRLAAKEIPTWRICHGDCNELTLGLSHQGPRIQEKITKTTCGDIQGQTRASKGGKTRAFLKRAKNSKLDEHMLYYDDTENPPYHRVVDSGGCVAEGMNVHWK